MLREDVSNWLLTLPPARAFQMPSGAGSLYAKDIPSMLSRGIDPYSDFKAQEIIDVVTKAFEEALATA